MRQRRLETIEQIFMRSHDTPGFEVWLFEALGLLVLAGSTGGRT